MSNILRLCEILKVSPNELLCHETPADLSEESGQPLSGSDSQTTPKRPRMKLLIALLLVLCFVSGTVLGIVIKSNLPEEDNRQKIPVDFSVSGYDLFSEGGSQTTKMLRLNFTPSVSNPEYEYKIIVTNDDGVSREFGVRAGAEGAYTGTFEVTTGYSHYLISVSMKVGDNTYSDALIKIWNIDETGYSWEKIEK